MVYIIVIDCTQDMPLLTQLTFQEQVQIQRARWTSRVVCMFLVIILQAFILKADEFQMGLISFESRAATCKEFFIIRWGGAKDFLRMLKVALIIDEILSIAKVCWWV
eukprot:TRINITY_DN4264_c1_g1_i2.p2 TRINITY_DN4264_c1_g1~~TRINITY_DN4264_c1_g1_i2.p2  ORF type:complete len:107 (+),score=12.09 TRINITY_DN4264_c1_g1_i2:335-655(+)